MKLSVMNLRGILRNLTPSLSPLRTPLSSKTPEDTWRIGGVLTNFLMLDLDETHRKASQGYFEYLNTISTPIKNSPSSKTPGRDLEDWWSLDKLPNVGYC